MRQLLITIFSITLVFSSCSISDEYRFNKDWSGSYKSEIDLSGLMETKEEEQSDEDFIPSEELKKAEDKINAIEGISNGRVRMDNESYKLIVLYSFEDLDAVNRLNASDLTEDDDSPLDGLGVWEMSTKGKKKFFMKMKGLEKIQSENENSDPESMGEMLKVNTTLTFPRKIKELESDLARISDNGKQVIIEYTVGDLWNKNTNWDIFVKL